MRFPLGLSTSLAAYIIGRRLAGASRPPLVLMLEPLFACNLNCSTCGRIREYRHLVSEQLSLDNCIASAEECGAPIVSICGGEPLLYPNIGELVRRLIEMKKYVYLCTNGCLLESKLGLFEPSRRLLFNVHIDGLADTHDAVCEHEGTYAAALRGIAAARRREFQVTINTTVCRQTDMSEIDSMMTELGALGARTFMLSPAFSYESVEDKDCFMTREDVREKFRDIDQLASRHRLSDTPVYVEFLKGERELECAAWGNPTRNPAGWRSPCYLIADRHFPTYEALMRETDWTAYGVGRDPRCRNCMVHCGFEPAAALMLNRRRGDLWKMVRWQFG
jgi:hopanoid biosynthesis associated radical SAM protein HpnH